MADEEQPEETTPTASTPSSPAVQSDRDINIQSTVNVGTANDKSSVSGANVSVGSAREVNIHSDTTPPPSFRSVALVGVLAFLGAVFINIATSQLPQSLQPPVWLSWLLVLLVTAAGIWVAYRQSRNSPSAVSIGGPLDERNRARMLDKVENFWIKGVLEQSLYQIARLELGLEQAPDKVDHPWQTVLQTTTTSRVVPAGTPIIKLFDDLDGKLLILGAPGAGKTTLLLELARDLIARARSDSQHPIPLVFNLTTWVISRKSLQEWLIDELKLRYDVPHTLARQCFATDAILPLLDGLDEVAAEQQADCVEAINTYRQTRGPVPLAVCCREVDYETMTAKLQLQGSVVIQPLTHTIVNTYLRQVGRPLAAVRAALRDDPTLWELLDNPLVLSIVALTYKAKSAAKLRAAGTPEDRRRQLFDDYIMAMFFRVGRSKKAIGYTLPQTKKWLIWLSNHMIQQSTPEFNKWWLAPNWLPTRQQNRFRLYIRLLTGLFGATVGGLLGWLIDKPVAGLLIGLGIGLIFELISGVFISAAKEEGRHDLLFLKEGWLGELPTDGITGTLSNLVGCLGLILSAGLYCILAIFLATKLGDWLANKLNILQDSGLGVWLVYLLFAAVAFYLVILLGGAVFVMLSVCYDNLQRYFLYWVLYSSGALPLRLDRFLNHCTERIFLRKIGHRYIFVHRLLMEHFASLYTEQQAAPTNAGAAPGDPPTPA